MLKVVWPLGILAVGLTTVGGYVAFKGEHKSTQTVVDALAQMVGGYAALNGEHKAPARYRTVAVSRGTMIAAVTATGTINPVRTVMVGTQVTGRIQSLHADFNSMVKAGDVVATIDPAVYQARRDQAEANLATAQASVSNTLSVVAQRKRELDRIASLLEQQFVSQNDVDMARTLHQGAAAQLEVTRAQVLQAEAQLRATDLDLNSTVIRAPANGIVIARTVEVGQTVTAGFQTPNLFLIAQDLTQMQIDTNVSEADIGGIGMGDEATFTVDAYPAEVFHGTVKQVRQAPSNIQNVITYIVVIKVGNRDLRLKMGMTAHVTVIVAKKDDVVRVPGAALRFTPPRSDHSAAVAKTVHSSGPAEEPAGPTAVVWKLGPEGGPEAISIQAGMADEQYVEALAGELKEGDKVIIGVDGPKEKKADALPPGFSSGKSKRK